MKISATNIIKKMNSLFKKSTIWFKVAILLILVLVVFIAIWVEEKDNIFNYVAQAGLVVLILNIVMMCID